MRIQLNRRLAAAAVVPVVLLSLSACGDKDKDKDADKPSPAPTASDTNTGSESPSDTASESESTSTSGDDISADDFAKLIEAGLEASTTAKMKMEITANSMVTSATGEIDYTGDQPATHMKMTMPGQTGEMDLIMVDGVIFMSMPMLGEGYFKIDLSKKGPLTEQFGSLEQFDLRTTMKMFTEGLESVKKIGEEDVDGTSATHYEVTANPKKLGGMLGGSAAPGELPETMTYDVWLDGEGRFTKMEADLDGAGTVNMTISEWGAPVEIKAPPASEVQEFPGM